jgi:ribosomal protein S24E
MNEHSAGSTGIAKLHYNFSNEDRLHSLPEQPTYKQPTQSGVGMPINRQSTVPDYPYERFERLMNEYRNGRKNVSRDELRKMLSNTSKRMYYNVKTLRAKRYLGKYKQRTGLIVDDTNKKTEEYEAKYSAYKSIRDEYPDVFGSDRARLLEQISSEIGITVSRLYSYNYEGTWRKEHETK